MVVVFEPNLPGKICSDSEAVNGLKVTMGPIPQSFSVQHVTELDLALLQRTPDIGQPFG